MSSYFDYFCKNIEVNNTNTGDFIKGTCYSMCPKDESNLREKEHLVHVLEVVGPEKKLVKSYSRSAADSNMAIPHLLRPYNVLKETVEYLLLNVTKRRDVSACVLYDFINDRLRAVRQDMTIQRLPSEQCITLLEPMVRFYVYNGYKLCEYPLGDFDPVLNKKYLLECLKWLLNCCDNVHASESSPQISELSGFHSNLEIKTRNVKGLTCDRPLMESLYILCNLDDVHPLFRYLTLPKDIKSNLSVQLSYNIAIDNLKGNFVKICRIMERLCPLTYCALFVQLPVIQRHALRVLSIAYSSKQLSVPIDILRGWLWFDSAGAAGDVCVHYGLKTGAGVVNFLKGDFKTDVVVHQPKKHLLHDEKLDLDVQNIFTYSTNNQ